MATSQDVILDAWVMVTGFFLKVRATKEKKAN